MPYRNLSMIVLAIFVAGCVTKYQPDLTNRSTARVRVVSTYPIAALAAVLKAECAPHDTISWDSKAQLLGALWAGEKLFGGKSARQSIGMPNPPEESIGFIERQIPADLPISLGFYASTAGTASGGLGGMEITCTGGVMFTPTPDTDYEVRFLSKTRGCAISVRQLKVDGDRETFEHVPGVIQLPRCAW